MAEFIYSEKYADNVYEYRHVHIPKSLVRDLPKRLMNEVEWRKIGVQQSLGWEHYMIHRPEPHILLFRRLLGFDQDKALRQYRKQLIDTKAH